MWHCSPSLRAHKEVGVLVQVGVLKPTTAAGQPLEPGVQAPVPMHAPQPLLVRVEVQLVPAQPIPVVQAARATLRAVAACSCSVTSWVG